MRLYDLMRGVPGEPEAVPPLRAQVRRRASDPAHAHLQTHPREEAGAQLRGPHRQAALTRLLSSELTLEAFESPMNCGMLGR